jgi:hypothetical protein
MLNRILACTILLLLPAITAYAAPSLKATPTALDGGTYTVPISLYGNSTAIAAVGVELTYNPAVLELVSTNAGPAATAAGKQVTATPAAKGDLTVGIFGMNTNKIMDGVVATVIFRVKPGQELAAKTLTYVFSASTPAGDDLTLDQAGGTLTME